MKTSYSKQTFPHSYPLAASCLLRTAPDLICFLHCSLNLRWLFSIRLFLTNPTREWSRWRPNHLFPYWPIGLQLLPYISTEEVVIALGATALNLFFNSMSICWCYLPNMKKIDLHENTFVMLSANWQVINGQSVLCSVVIGSNEQAQSSHIRPQTDQFYTHTNKCPFLTPGFATRQDHRDECWNPWILRHKSSTRKQSMVFTPAPALSHRPAAGPPALRLQPADLWRKLP